MFMPSFNDPRGKKKVLPELGAAPEPEK